MRRLGSNCGWIEFFDYQPYRKNHFLRDYWKIQNDLARRHSRISPDSLVNVVSAFVSRLRKHTFHYEIGRFNFFSKNAVMDLLGAKRYHRRVHRMIFTTILFYQNVTGVLHLPHIVARRCNLLPQLGQE
jgi:hypothetical protein